MALILPPVPAYYVRTSDESGMVSDRSAAAFYSIALLKVIFTYFPGILQFVGVVCGGNYECMCRSTLLSPILVRTWYKSRGIRSPIIIQALFRIVRMRICGIQADVGAFFS